MWDHGSGWGMMGDWGFMGLGLIFWLVILAAAVAALVWFVRSQQGASGGRPRLESSAGLQILEERYARGEIDREEYLQKKRDILD